MNLVIYDNIMKLIPKERVFFAEPMDRHTTFRVGGEAEVFIQVQNKEELAKIIVYLRKLEADYFVLGNGSNLLVSDKGYQGVILQIGEKMSEITVEGNVIYAQAGALLSKIANVAEKHSLTGMEFAAGIPGTIGGAAVMNAGAYDGEMKNIVKTVTVLSKEGDLLELNRASMEFSYRNSVIKNKPFIVVEVCLTLEKGNSEEIKEKMQDFSNKRQEKQPLNLPSAGSTFKRPEGHFAGKLIMDAGLRGFRIGGAQVSEKHCGFVVNIGNAMASDIYELMEEVKKRVQEQFQVTLEAEVVCLGEF